MASRSLTPTKSSPDLASNHPLTLNPLMNRLEEKRANRFRFLNAVYELTDGQRQSMVSMWEIGDGLNLSRDEVANTVQYLVGESLVEHIAMGGEIGITHYGIVQVEEALSEPERPTHYFPPVVNIMHVHSMVNSQVQQGSHGSSQSQQINQNDLSAIRDLIAGLADAVGTSGLTTAAQAELEAEIATLQAQI